MTRANETLVPVAPPFVGDDDIGEIRNIVGFHIRLAHGATYRHFTETFSGLDLTQTDLAQRMRMDRATTMAIVNRLEAKKYLRRGKSPSDGRKQTLNLTDHGRKALVVAKDAILAHERWLKSRFTEKEVETLIELLTRLHE